MSASPTGGNTAPLLQREPSFTYPDSHVLARYTSSVVLEPPLRRPYPLCLLFLGVFCVLLGSTLSKAFDRAVGDAVWQQLRLDSATSESFPGFEFARNSKNPDKVLLRFFVFDVQNPEAIVRHKAAPVILERGPYVYELELDHVNCSFVQDPPEHELYFQTWQRVRPVTEGPEAGLWDSDLVTTVNVPFQILLADAGDVKRAAIRALYKDQLEKDASKLVFTTRPVREHLFGYDKAFARPTRQGHFAKSMLDGVRYPGFVQNFSTVQELVRSTGVDSMRVDRAASHTFKSWQGSTQVRRCKSCAEPLWGSALANRVGGSDGKFFTRADGGMQVWLPELVRRAELVPRPDLKPARAVKAKVFGLHPATFANATTLPANAAYYATDQPDGLLYMGRLLMDVPVYASHPHFLFGDASLLRGLVGLEPGNEALHATRFEVHTETGVSMLVAERFQYNMLLKPDAHVEQLSALPRVYLPMFWFETLERLSRRHEDLFARCDQLTAASHGAGMGFVGLGVALLLASLTIATLNAEKDAVANQRHALALHGAPGEEGEEEMDANLGLVWASPSLRRAWGAQVFVAFCMNTLIQFLSLRGKASVGVRTTVAWQIPLTCMLVTYFSVVGAVAVARASFARGEFKRVRARWPFVDRPLGCSVTGLAATPLRLSGNSCVLGVLMGLTAVLMVAVPIVAVAELVCSGDCRVPTTAFVLGKAALAALLVLVTFPLAALRTLAERVG